MRAAGKAPTLSFPLPSPCPMIHDAIGMPAMIATIAQNSVVLNACFLSPSSDERSHVTLAMMRAYRAEHPLPCQTPFD